MGAVVHAISPKWTLDDFRAGYCSVNDIGLQRPSEDLPPEAPPSLPNLTEDELTQLPIKVIRRDLLRAYQRLGGAEWLVTQPQLVGKMLLRSMPAELAVDEKTDVQVTISWAGADRLSYRSAPPAEVVDAVQKELPWKDPYPDAKK